MHTRPGPETDCPTFWLSNSRTQALSASSKRIRSTKIGSWIGAKAIEIDIELLVTQRIEKLLSHCARIVPPIADENAKCVEAQTRTRSESLEAHEQPVRRSTISATRVLREVGRAVAGVPSGKIGRTTLHAGTVRLTGGGEQCASDTQIRLRRTAP